jgi:hypothetical protein
LKTDGIPGWAPHRHRAITPDPADMSARFRVGRSCHKRRSTRARATTGSGLNPKKLAGSNPGHMHRGHDLWNISLKFLCESTQD